MARRGSGRRTDYTWGHIGDLEEAHDLTSGEAQLGGTSFAFNESQTVTRVRGKVAVELDAGAVSEHALVLFGLQIMSKDAFSSAAASELFVADGADEGSWLWQGQLWVSAGDEGTVNQNFLSAQMEIDTKAMRKVKINEVLAFVFQTPAALTLDATGTINIAWYLHILVGL